MIKELNGNNLNELIGKGVYLVDFYATWCGPCKMLMPIVESLKDEIDIIKVNIDENMEEAQNRGIMSVPTLIFFKDGKECLRQNGFIDKNSLLKMVNSLK